MTGPSLDLDALREALEYVERTYANRDGDHWLMLDADEMGILSQETRAVLALVEEQRKENERLRTVAKRIRYEASSLYSGRPEHVYLDRLVAIRSLVEDALAGSPAENKEPS